VLTGVNIGDFGNHTEETFLDLIQELDKIHGIKRFRISSIEPNLLTDDILEFIKDSNSFLPHFHIPLQSGCDKTLKAMQRRYNTQLFSQRVKAIKSIFPDACIASDVIVGFPGETEEDFNTTYQFIENSDISYCHVFSYSERDNTPALKIAPSISKAERLTRSKKLRQLSDFKRNNFYRTQLNKTHPVLIESFEYGICSGLTDNYIRVKFSGEETMLNTVQITQLNSIDGAVVYGDINQ